MGAESDDRRAQPLNEHRVTRTRNRVPLSCVACRARKLKCNREKPCQNCLVRGDAVAAACSYAGPTNSKGSEPRTSKPVPIDMRTRIDRLETLVRSLISQEARSNGPSEKDPALVVRLSRRDRFSSESVILEDSERGGEIPRLPGGQKMSMDTRSTHWNAILHDITAIKDAWLEQDEVRDGIIPQSSTSNHRPSLLNGLTKPPEFNTLVASLPPRTSTDKLISRFFETYNPAIPAQFIIHRPTFLKKYDQHWKASSETQIIWIGLLFSILCFAMQSYEDTDEEPPEFLGTSKVLTELYRTRAAQCIVAADITKPTEHMIEALLVYSLVEYYDQADGDIEVWMISGLIMRLALQQGYHRDPSQHPGMSPFQVEMRRRLWMTVSQHELIFAVQLGLPKMIRYAECDTLSPINVYDEELREDIIELPPSRPEAEPTPVIYQIAKSRILRAYGYVIEHLHIVQEQPYESVMKLDARLAESRSLIPAQLLLIPENERRNEAAGSLMEKYILEHFYHKGICVLHRKYLNCFLTDDTYAYSRKACIVSALELLRQQVSLHFECQPGGRLERIKWYRFSLIKHDFLLAAMVLCLAIYNDKTPSGTNGPETVRKINLVQRLEILQALERGKRIWAEVACDCVDSRRALNILTTVLDTLGMNNMQVEMVTADRLMAESDSMVSSTNDAANFSGPVPNNSVNGTIEKSMDQSWTSQADANTLGDVNSIAFPIEAAYYGNDTIHDNLFSSGGIFNSFEPDLNVPANLDWAAWDSFINNGNRLDLPPDDGWSTVPSFQIPIGIAPYQ